MTVIIEKNIPLAQSAKETGTTSILKKLQIGDSFVFPLEQRAKVLNLSYYIKIKLATRKINETEMRVWRTA